MLDLSHVIILGQGANKIEVYYLLIQMQISCYF
jgi:hypothetical protein